ncbi:hypothetical protein FNYG_15746 [Fusarium nygamai]|uniref:Uncharacterized protein n=1 Tax=Gibberella nygamai TaxID=42673 RepID=A0A2K0U716_GIBNY|nr:hypothetical protein FNYG_15746 [Fusarium nygamai]
MALESLSEITGNGYLESALLGRTTHYHDECIMIRRITNRVAESSSTLIHRIAEFDQHIDPFCLDAWKLVYCDVCYVDGGSATLQEIYEARLREEELQTPTERARELVRDSDLKRARRNAKWMIPAIEGLSEDDKKGWQDKDPDRMNRLCEQLRLLLAKRLDQERDFNEIERRKIEEIQELLLKPRNCQDILEGVWKQVSPAPPP